MKKLFYTIALLLAGVVWVNAQEPQLEPKNELPEETVKIITELKKVDIKHLSTEDAKVVMEILNQIKFDNKNKSDLVENLRAFYIRGDKYQGLKVKPITDPEIKKEIDKELEGTKFPAAKRVVRQSPQQHLRGVAQCPMKKDCPKAAQCPVKKDCPKAAQCPMKKDCPKAAQCPVKQDCPKAAQCPVKKDCPKAAQCPMKKDCPKAAQCPVKKDCPKAAQCSDKSDLVENMRAFYIRGDKCKELKVKPITDPEIKKEIDKELEGTKFPAAKRVVRQSPQRHLRGAIHTAIEGINSDNIVSVKDFKQDGDMVSFKLIIPKTTTTKKQKINIDYKLSEKEE